MLLRLHNKQFSLILILEIIYCNNFNNAIRSRLAEILENNFNIIFLQQTLGTVFLLCLTLYHAIVVRTTVLK